MVSTPCLAPAPSQLLRRLGIRLGSVTAGDQRLRPTDGFGRMTYMFDQMSSVGTRFGQGAAAISLVAHLVDSIVRPAGVSTIEV